MVLIDTIPMRTLRTAEDGRFTFCALPRRNYRLVARTADHTSGARPFRVVENVAMAALYLFRGAEISILVTDREGNPVQDAAVTSVPDRVHATTNGRGVAVLTPIAPGIIELRASSRSFGVARTRLAVTAAAHTVTLVLHPPVTVNGRVVDECGLGVANIRVVAVPVGILEPNAIGSSAYADDDGRFNVTALPSVPHRFVAEDNTHAPARSGIYRVGVTSPRLELVVRKGLGIVGSVLDEGGNPVPSTVSLTALDEWIPIQSRRVLCGGDGKFEIPGLSRGRYVALAESDSLASECVHLELCEDNQRLALIMRPVANIAGMITNEDGIPRPGVQLDITCIDFPSIVTSVETDTQGEFCVPSLPPGRFLLEPARFNRHIEHVQQKVAYSGDRGTRVVVCPTGGVRGRVLIAETNTYPQFVTMRIGGGLPITFSTDGVFEIIHIPAGTHSMTVHATDCLELILSITVVPGEVTNLDAVFVSRGITVSGLVIDTQHAPVSGAVVTLGYSAVLSTDELDLQMGWVRSSSISDANGKFALRGVDKDRPNLLIGATHPLHGRSPSTRVAEYVEGECVTLPLRQGGAIDGRVLCNGNPVRGAIVTIGEPETDFEQTDSDGFFSILDVPAGEHFISIRQLCSNVQVWRSRITVRPGAVSSIAIDIH